jgi:hypothetical protein
MSNGASPYSAFPAYATWAVHLGFDGWIYASCQQDLRLSGEVTGRQWMDMLANGIAAKGGMVRYSLDRKDEQPPPIVVQMIDFMSEALDANLKYEPDVDPPIPPDDPDLTVLMRKARDGDLFWVSDLLDRHVDMEMEDDVGCTALSHACYYGQLEIVQRLMEAGADPNHQSRNGNTALMMAVQNQQLNRSEICRALLSHGANPNAKNKKGQTALDLCPRGDQRTAQIIRGFKGKKAHELRPWYDSMWFMTVVGVLAAAAAIYFGVWLAQKMY